MKENRKLKKIRVNQRITLGAQRACNSMAGNKNEYKVLTKAITGIHSLPWIG